MIVLGIRAIFYENPYGDLMPRNHFAFDPGHIVHIAGETHIRAAIILPVRIGRAG